MAGFEEKEIDLHFRGDYLYFSAKAPEAGLQEEGVQYFKRRLKLTVNFYRQEFLALMS